MYFVILIESLKVSSAGITFIDSTKLVVCITKDCVFTSSASGGKSSGDWLYGFKLHLICDHVGRLVSYSKLKEKLFGDHGYIGKIGNFVLLRGGVQLITCVKRRGLKSKHI